jgi:hypothetical protein
LHVGFDAMSLVTFAIGVLLAVAGALAMYYGFGIVEVERGWTEVISGTIALTGGVIVMALALILRALRDLQVSRDLRPQMAEAPRRPAVEPRPEPAAEPKPQRLAAPPAPPAEPPPGAELRRPEPWPPVVAAAPQPAAEPPRAQPPRAEVSESLPPAERFADRPPDRAPERERGGEWVGVEAELDLFYEANAAQAPATAPTSLEPMPVASEGTPRAPALGREPEPARAPSEAPEAPGSEPSAVIGRYQADGTSYTMYADGSIEVEAPEGNYKFPSMAELKAFIEQKV